MRIDSKKEKIIFPKAFTNNWREMLDSIIKSYKELSVSFNIREWHLNCKDISYIQRVCDKEKLHIAYIESSKIESIISASSLGIHTLMNSVDSEVKENQTQLNSEHRLSTEGASSNVLFHIGTLRSGEVLEAIKNVLILGDVNPGAKVIAGGDVMIWGRLLGIAHAGKNGNVEAKITALQLRPVQLRIASKVARGPKEKPDEGLAEEASIEEDLIVIKPARSY